MAFWCSGGRLIKSGKSLVRVGWKNGWRESGESKYRQLRFFRLKNIAVFAYELWVQNFF